MPKAASLATKLLNTYNEGIEVELVPSSGGCFELSLDGNLAYSKLKTGSFPDEDEMVELVGKHLK